MRRLQARVSKMQRHHVEELISFHRENAHLWECHRSWKPEANPSKGGEVESTTINLPRATNFSIHSNTNPPSLNTLGKQFLQFKNLFVPSIMEATLPSNRKNLTIEKYDGTIDPNEHLNVYIIQVGIYTTDNAILCQVFPTSLKGQTLHWFMGLPPPPQLHGFIRHLGSPFKHIICH